jgi:pantothenate kinase-related protein Tda10
MLLTACLDSEFREVCNWLSTWNFWSRQQDVLSQRVGETCSWFLEISEFIQWKSDAPRFLHCYGPPGIGKTVLTSVIIHHLQTTTSPDSRVVAFFCDNTTKGRYTLLLGTLLQQLIKNKCSDWNGMKAFTNSTNTGRSLNQANCWLSCGVS